MNYKIENTDDIISPSLIYYLDAIKSNITEIIRVAGDKDRLWPHVKTYKCIRMVELLMSYGIKKFKAATIAEAEMCAMAGADKVVLAYPLVGPNMRRLINLAKSYPATEFYAIEDDYNQFELLSDTCCKLDFRLKCLVDVNPGLNRTGVSLNQTTDFYQKVSGLRNIELVGLHVYDGNHNNPDAALRTKEVQLLDQDLVKIVNQIKEKGLDCSIVIAGGTPEFPCHSEHSQWYLSPGTSFINDAGYAHNFKDLKCVPGAAIMTRVISRPAEGYFTLDLGYKGIAADPPGQRGVIVGYEDAEEIMQNEEHWVWKLNDLSRVPTIGDVVYVIPVHICPTTALYPEVLIAQDGKIIDHWQVTARNRRINF